MSGRIVYQDSYQTVDGAVVIRKTKEPQADKWDSQGNPKGTVTPLDPYQDSDYKLVAQGGSGAVIVKRKEPHPPKNS